MSQSNNIPTETVTDKLVQGNINTNVFKPVSNIVKYVIPMHSMNNIISSK